MIHIQIVGIIRLLIHHRAKFVLGVNYTPWNLMLTWHLSRVYHEKCMLWLRNITDNNELAFAWIRPACIVTELCETNKASQCSLMLVSLWLILKHIHNVPMHGCSAMAAQSSISDDSIQFSSGKGYTAHIYSQQDKGCGPQYLLRAGSHLILLWKLMHFSNMIP